MILFVDNNKGILFLGGAVITQVKYFLKITYMNVKEIMTQIITAEDSI